MIYSVFLLPSAYNDLVRAENFYDSISPGLGQYCIDTLLSDIDPWHFTLEFIQNTMVIFGFCPDDFLMPYTIKSLTMKCLFQLF